MQIVLNSPAWNPATPELLAALDGIEFGLQERVPGCSAIPSICALDDAGELRREWRPDQKIDPAEIAQWAKMDGTPLPPPPPPPGPVPETISDRQFAHALYKMTVITYDEALAFVKIGTIPAQLAEVISAIPDEEARRDAELTVAGAVEYRRSSALTAALAAGKGWSSDQVDDLWRMAAAL